MRNDPFDAYMRAHAQPVPVTDGYEKKLKKTLESLPVRASRRRRGLPMGRLALAAALAVVLVLVVTPGSEVMLTTQYLKAYSSEDGQQYIVEGIYKEADILGKADADADGWVRMKDHAELMTFLGMSPQIPQTVGGCWQLSDMVGRYMDYGLYLGLNYACPDRPQERLGFTVESQPYMQEQMEQHARNVEEGTQTEIEINGMDVYAELLLRDEDDPDSVVCKLSWAEDLCSFSVQGLSSMEELKEIAAQMMDMYRAWPQAVKDRWIPTGQNDYGVDSRTFTSYEEMDAFFGGRVPVPAEQYGEWTIRDYAGNKWMVDSWQYDVHAWYQHPDRPQDYLIVSTFNYQDFENVNMSFEQSDEGRVIRHKNLDIYVTRNIDSLVCIALKDRTLYYVTGDVELDMAKSILDELVW